MRLLGLIICLKSSSLLSLLSKWVKSLVWSSKRHYSTLGNIAFIYIIVKVASVDGYRLTWSLNVSFFLQNATLFDLEITITKNKEKRVIMVQLFWQGKQITFLKVSPPNLAISDLNHVRFILFYSKSKNWQC